MSNFIEYYVECPDVGGDPPPNNECNTDKTVSWSSAGLQTTYFFVQNVDENLVSFTFSAITNNGSSIEVDLVYARNGVEVTATTFNLGVITSNSTKYHYLDFGNNIVTNAVIYLKFRISGGTTGSIDVFLNCDVNVGSRQFCYLTLPAAARDLCPKCTNQKTFYFERPKTNAISLPQNNFFNYGNLYEDPLLSILAPAGYYVPTDAQSPKVIWSFTGGTPSVAYYCDPNSFPCNDSKSQIHSISTDYKYSNPYIQGVQGIQLSGLKYSTKEYFLIFPNTNWGYFTLTVSNNQTYQEEVLFTISDVNAPLGQAGVMSYTEDTIPNSEFFKTLLPQSIFSVPKNSSKTIRVIINGQPLQLTNVIRIRVSVGVKRGRKTGANITTTVSASCLNTIYSASTGLHAYSAYDAANSPKCTTKLFSTTAPASWGVNSRVYHDPFFNSPALPYFYAYGSNVFKVGQPYKREFGTKLYYEIKTNTFKQFGKMLGLSKKNPTTVTPKLEGPKDWQTTTQVPSCIEPVMKDIGLIKYVLPTSGLKVPTSYLYLVGKSASSKTAANDSVFGEYDWNNGSYKPITGLIHALTKVVGGYAKASTDVNIQTALGSSWQAAVALSLGVTAALIATAPAAFGLSLATASISAYSTSIAALNLGLSQAASYACVGLGSALSATGIGVIVLLVALALVALFWPQKKTLKEDNCKQFDKVYAGNEYLELSDTIYTLSGLTSPGITGYYTDGGYFYTTTSGTINTKEVSYTTRDGGRIFSSKPDDPTEISLLQNFFLLPYVSGNPVKYTTAVFYSTDMSTSVLPTTNVGALNTPSSITYQLPYGFFEADTQVEADNLATAYLSGLTAQTQGIYVSADSIPTASATTTIFSHEIKIEDTPSLWPVCYNNSDNLGLTVGRVLYYDTNGLFTVLDGYYSLSGQSGNFRTFYKTSAGTIVDYYTMTSSGSTTVTSPTSGSLPVVTTGQSYSSSWYFYGETVGDVLYDDSNNINGFNQNWNNTNFYSSQYVKRGMIQNPASKTSFYIFDNNTSSYSFQNAPEGWYKEIPGAFDENPFLTLSAITIYLDMIQNCTLDSDENGIYITCVDISGNTMPSFYGVSGVINVSTSSGTTSYEYVIENDEYRVLVPLGAEFIGAITGATLTTNPVDPSLKITYSQGVFTSCVTPTPTPTPEYNPCSCRDITFDGNITHASLTAYWTDCSGTPQNYFVVADTTYGPVCAQAGSAYGQAFTIGDCCTVTPTPTPTPTITPTLTQTPTVTTPGQSIQLSTPQNDDCVACRLTSYSQTRYVNPSDTTPTVNDIVYQNSDLTTVFNGNSQWFKTSWGGDLYSIQINSSGVILSVTTCSSCPSQTPTPSVTATPTLTPSITPTMTETPTETPTPTPTETPTPSPIPCFEYVATADQTDLDNSDNDTVYFEYVACNGTSQTEARGTTTPSNPICARSVGTVYILVSGSPSSVGGSSWSVAGDSC